MEEGDVMEAGHGKGGMTNKTDVKEGDIEEGSKVNGTSRMGEDEWDVKEE